MAVLPAVPGLEVEIQVTNNALQEYTNMEIEDNDKAAVRYIEATSNQEFAICSRFSPEFAYQNCAISIQYYIDGVKVDTRLVLPQQFKDRLPTSFLCDGSYLHESPGKFSQRALRFSELSIGIPLAQAAFQHDR